MGFLVRQVLPATALLALALFAPRLGGRLFRRIEATIARLSHQFGRALALVALLGTLTGAGVSALCGLPQPAVHDEFSYLLAADTYAHGRMTNPTPALWPHFETFHVLMRPTYQSKYPPGQGLVLAFGQRLFGQPIVGTWLCMGLACAALAWMLRAWMPGRWALLGGLLATLNLSLLAWCHNYWGGTLAVLGGALALGGMSWTLREPIGRHGALMGLGIALLAISRAYEGFVYAVLLLATLLFTTLLNSRRLPRAVETAATKAQSLPTETQSAVGVGRLRAWVAATSVARHRELNNSPAADSTLGMVKEARWGGVSIRRAVVPLALVVLAALVGIGVYNRAVTGNALRLPYQVYEEQYAIVPLFLFQPTRPVPAIRDPFMRRYAAENQLAPYLARRTIRGYLADAWNRARACVLGYLRPTILALPLLTLPWVLLHDRRMRTMLAVFLGFVFFLSLEKGMFLHYTAPVMGLTWLFALQALRTLRVWRPGGRPVGRFLMRAVVVACLALTVKWARDYRGQDFGVLPRERPRLLAQLERIPGDHLILVHYRSDHKVDEEWVYNRADIEHARVIWAREFGGAADNDLLTRYKARHIWRLDGDARPPSLTPYERP